MYKEIEYTPLSTEINVITNLYKNNNVSRETLRKMLLIAFCNEEKNVSDKKRLLTTLIIIKYWDYI